MKLFRLKDVVQIVGNEKSAKDLLQNYKKQQLIYRIRRNLYTITDLATKQAIATKRKLFAPENILSYLEQDQNEIA